MLFFSFMAFFFPICAMEISSFLKKYPGKVYQDIIIQNKIYPIGTDICDLRYQLLKPVLEQFSDSFSVLDIGAAQGYFSFSVAKEFPQSKCIMIEEGITHSSYSHHGNMLEDLYRENSYLSNVAFIKKNIALSDIILWNNNFHFDVIFALLVVHLIDRSLIGQIKIIEALLKLTDNLILEVANDVNVLLFSYVEHLSKTLNCKFLGEVKRHKNEKSTSTGFIFWFKNSTKLTINCDDVFTRFKNFYQFNSSSLEK